MSPRVELSPARLEAVNEQTRLELDKIIGKVGIEPIELTGGRILGLGLYLMAQHPDRNKGEAMRCMEQLYDQAAKAAAALDRLERGL